MMGWLVRFEAYPEFFTSRVDGYQGWLSRDLLMSDSWLSIRLRDVPIGYAHVTLETDESNLAAYVVLESQVVISQRVLGFPRNAEIRARAELDFSRRLQRFELAASFLSTDIHVTGKREEGNQFLIEMNGPQGTRFFRQDIPDDLLLGSSLGVLGLRDMEPGRAVSVRMLDLVTLQRVPLRVRSLRRETLTFSDTPYPATVLEVELKGWKTTVWVGADGRLLRQQMDPITMEWSTPKAAMAAIDKTPDADSVRESLRSLGLQSLIPVEQHDPP